MKRNLYVARQLLEVVEENADSAGLAYVHMLSLHVGPHGVPTSEDLYQIEILVKGGFLSRTPLTASEPIMVQLTWSGHDLLDQLRADHSE
jgi:hypothetical protein